MPDKPKPPPAGAKHPAGVERFGWKPGDLIIKKPKEGK